MLLVYQFDAGQKDRIIRLIADNLQYLRWSKGILTPKKPLPPNDLLRLQHITS